MCSNNQVDCDQGFAGKITKRFRLLPPPMLKYANKWTKNSFCSQMNTYHEFIRQTTILIILVWIGNGCGRICFRSTKC